MPDTNIGGIYYDLDLDDNKFKSKIGTASKDITTLGDRFKSAEAGSTAFAGGLAVAGAAVAGFGTLSVMAYNEAEAAQKQLEHAVVGVSKATKEQLQQTMDLADALEAKGVLDGDNIKVGLAQLSTFGLSNKAVQALGGSLADLAVNQFGVNASGEQLSQSANMIAKALNGQFGVLEKSGIRFTELQKSIIATGTEMEKTKAINEGFAQNLKYTNDVARQTGEGGLAHLKVQFGNLQEEIGKLISNSINPLIASFSKWFDSMGGPSGILDNFNKKILPYLNENLPILVGIIIGGLIPAFVALGASIWATFAPLLPFLAIGALVGVLVKELIDTMGGFDKVMQKLKETFDKVVEVFNMTLKPSLDAFWQTVINNLIPALMGLWNTISPILLPILKTLAIFVGGALISALYIAINVLNGVANAISWVINVINTMLSGIRDIGGTIYNAMRGVKDGLVTPFREAFDWIKNAVSETVRKLNDLNPFTRHSPSLIDRITSGVQVIKDQYASLSDISIPRVSSPDVLGIAGGTTENKSANVYIQNVRDYQDVEAIGRELGFKFALNPA